MINIDPPSSPLALDALATLHKSALARFVNRARAAVRLDGEVEVLLTSDAEVKRLNKAFRGKNKATDVLSFPAPAEIPGVAGDLAVSLDTAARQAAEHGHALKDEVRILLLHGLLHLAGEDHETDSGEMAEREAELRRELGLPHGLIERASRPKTAAPKARKQRA
jgi:probable rRNA maturation factor